jgi:hypothetical protein
LFANIFDGYNFLLAIFIKIWYFHCRKIDMEIFHSEKQILRAHPTYVRACKTGPVMQDWPFNTSDDRKLDFAGAKMDWLFRGALKCQDNGYLTAIHISAIDGFIDYINHTIGNMRVTPMARGRITSRIEFGQLLLDLSIREYQHAGYPPIVGDQWFENFVASFGYTMDVVVYDNPFWVQYHLGGGYSGGLSDPNFNRFHHQIQRLWL